MRDLVPVVVHVAAELGAVVGIVALGTHVGLGLVPGEMQLLAQHVAGGFVGLGFLGGHVRGAGAVAILAAVLRQVGSRGQALEAAGVRVVLLRIPTRGVTTDALGIELPGRLKIRQRLRCMRVLGIGPHVPGALVALLTGSGAHELARQRLAWLRARMGQFADAQPFPTKLLELVLIGHHQLFHGGRVRKPRVQGHALKTDGLRGVVVETGHYDEHALVTHLDQPRLGALDGCRLRRRLVAPFGRHHEVELRELTGQFFRFRHGGMRQQNANVAAVQLRHDFRQSVCRGQYLDFVVVHLLPIRIAQNRGDAERHPTGLHDAHLRRQAEQADVGRNEDAVLGLGAGHRGDYVAGRQPQVGGTKTHAAISHLAQRIGH